MINISEDDMRMLNEAAAAAKAKSRNAECAEQMRRQLATAAAESPASPPPAKQASLFDTALDCGESGWRRYCTHNEAKGGDYGNFPWWWLRQLKGESRFRERGEKHPEALPSDLANFFATCQEIANGKRQAKSDKQRAKVIAFLQRMRTSRDRIDSPEDMRIYVDRVWDGVMYAEHENPVKKAIANVIARGYLEAEVIAPTSVRKGQIESSGSGRAHEYASTMNATRKVLVEIRNGYREMVRQFGIDIEDRLAEAKDWWVGRWDEQQRFSGSEWTGTIPWLVQAHVPVPTGDMVQERVFRLALWELASILTSEGGQQYFSGADHVPMYLGQKSIAEALGVAPSTAYHYTQRAAKDGLLHSLPMPEEHKQKRMAREYLFDGAGWVLWWTAETLKAPASTKANPPPMDWE